MKKSLKMLLFVLIAFSSSLGLYAQGSIEITGKVTDETGETLPGVSILIKGKQVGTITDVNGVYTIKADANDFLVFSYVGMETATEKAGNRKAIDVVLKNSSDVMLNEVVAIGYGSMRRKDLTGSVASADAAELAKVPVNNIAQALAGRMAGVNVIQSEGDPNNSSISIRVRGGISITQDNEPLYIVDGFPAESSLFQTLSPSDIESIDVLKDASATAIYGARGANGVVVITTKSGVEGKTTITYDGYVGVKNLSKKMDLLSIPEFAYLSYERNYKEGEMTSFENRFGAFKDIQSNWGNSKGVDWQDEAFRSAFSQNHKITATGGNKDFRYNLSYAYQDEQGLMIESGLTKNNIRARLENRINNRAKINASINFTQQKTYGMGTSDGGTNFSKMSSIIMFLPTLGYLIPDDVFRTIPNLNEYDPTLLDEAGDKPETGNTLQNPAASARAEKNIKEMRIFNANAGFEYNILNNLTFKNNTGILYRTQRNDIFNGANSINAIRTSINGSIQNLETGTIQTSNTLSYDYKKGLHKLNVLGGQEYVSSWSRWFRTSVTNFPNDDIGLNDLGLGLPSPSESYNSGNNDKLLSFFARGYYNYAEKYMLTVSARYDGSSKFGKDHKWGFFPSASFAWRAAEEKFIKDLNVFSDLKFRIGYGMAGNNRIPSFSSLAIWNSQLAPEANGTVPGYYPQQMPNDELRWEANKTFNVGLDMGFFDQRLTIVPEFYINRSSNLLLNATLPESSGHTGMIRNIGATENTGIDLTINSTNVRTKNFQWMTSLTFSHNKNKIVALSGEQSFLQSSNFGYATKDYIVEVGKPIGQIYGFKTVGLYQVDDFNYDAATNTYTLKDGVPRRDGKEKPGYWKFEDSDKTKLDANGNPLITEEDRQVIGDAQPLFYGGLNNTFVYKGFDLSVFMNFSYGNDILNATRLFASLYGWANKNTFAYNDSNHRWITVGSDGLKVNNPEALAKLNAGKTVAVWENMQNANQEIHSWGVEDGSFLRISNVTLGYTLPKQLTRKFSVENLRVYATANNLAVFTKYSGYDPEVSTRNSTGLTPGVDWSAYPRNRAFVFGINLTL
jgi:TonB-linked SusC/RagA family outer membrane protein